MNKVFNYENLNNIKVLSLKQSVDNTFEAWYSSICRWYSRSFYTPLHLVEDMSPETVLKTYYDDLYYKLVNSSDEESQKILDEEIRRTIYLQKDPVAAEIEEVKAEQEDDEWYQEELRKINEELAKKGAKPNLIGIEKDSEIVEFEDTPPDFGEEE